MQMVRSLKEFLLKKEIQQHKVNHFTLHQVQPCLTMRSCKNSITFPFQHHLNRSANIFFVINHQDLKV